MYFNFPNDNKIIFISYSWDDDEHKTWVLRLALELEKNNFNIIIDRTHLKFGHDTRLFMRAAIEQSDIVLIIFTPNYADKAINRKGGVGFEYGVINMQLMQSIDENNKFLPILRAGTFENCIPDFFKPLYCSDMRDNVAFDLKVQELADRINEKEISLDYFFTDDNN
jgi:hypothetical protein